MKAIEDEMTVSPRRRPFGRHAEERGRRRVNGGGRRLVVPLDGRRERGTTTTTSRRCVFLVGVEDLARLRATVILTKPWSCRRAIRTTTGRALRVGRWSALRPRRRRTEQGSGRGTSRRRSGEVEEKW